MLIQKRMAWLMVLLSVLLCHSGIVSGQKLNPSSIDSLKKEAEKTGDDTIRVSILTKLAMYYTHEDPKEGLKYSKQAATLAEQINWRPGMATAYNSIGANYKSLGKYPEALEHLFKSMKINEELNNHLNLSKNMANIGNLYRELKNYNKALEYLGRALKEDEALGRKFGIENNYSDMAIVYSEMNDNKRALEYMDKALGIASETADREGEAIIHANIGNVLSQQKKYADAIVHLRTSMMINKELNRQVGLAVNYVDLGQLYLTVASDSSKADKEQPMIFDRAAYADTSALYFGKAVELFTQVSALDPLAASYNGLSNALAFRKDYKNAYEAYKTYKLLDDSMHSNDSKVKLANTGAERAEFEKNKQAEVTRLTQTKRRNESVLFAVVLLSFAVFTWFAVKERRKSDRLLLNILPEKVAKELKETGAASANNFDHVTVLFTDFVNFTSVAESMPADELVKELHTCFTKFDEITSKYGIEKIKTVGDAYIAVAGLPLPTPGHAVNTVRAALEITAFIAARKERMGAKTFDIRIGIHSGSVVAGIVGVKKFAYDIWGDTVNTAARMEQSSEAGKINISQRTYDLVKGGFMCTYRGEHVVKNKGLLVMYFVEKEIA